MDLQEIAVDLSEAIGRGVAIDDRQLRLLAHSAHHEDADPIRRESILTRTVPKAVIDWAFSFGIETADPFVRVPAAPDLESQSRMVFPLRAQGLLLGFLTVIDPDESLSKADCEACVEAAGRAAGVRYRQQFLRADEREQEQRLVRELLFGELERRPVAAEQLANEGISRGGSVAAVVVRWRRLAGLDDYDLEILIGRAFDRARRQLSQGALVELQRPESAIALVDSAALLSLDIRDFANVLLDLSAEYAAGAALDLAVGFGEPVAIGAARRSLDQATAALRAAERFEGLPSPVGWADLGVNRLVSLFPLSADALAEIPAGCRELVEHPELMQTVERYLDLACDAKATAAALSLHRASLYSRLQKAERVTGLSFKDGEDRLALHLGLRLLRLADEPGSDGEAVEEPSDKRR